MELKSFTLYLPVIAALGWAVVYAVSARNYETLTVPTGLMLHGFGIVAAGLLLSAALKLPIDFSPLLSHPQKFWFWLVPVTVLIASLALHLSLKLNSATYTGLVEILYVILIPLFAYMFFGQNQLNTPILIGGALMLVGVGFVFYGQLQKLS